MGCGEEIPSRTNNGATKSETPRRTSATSSEVLGFDEDDEVEIAETPCP
jgi:hypothetical protein